MLARRLASFGISLLGAALLVAGMLYWALRPAPNMHREFLSTVASDDPKAVMELFDPALREQVDEPVLGAWMAVVLGHLGAYQGIEEGTLQTSTKRENDTRVTQSTATVRFEKGTATSELVYHAGGIQSFTVRSESIPHDWFKGPRGTELYRERGRQFLASVLSGDAEAAFAFMHPALQQVFPLNRLKAVIAANATAGKLESLTYVSERLAPEKGYDLTIFYDVQCENARSVASVTFQFLDMKEHLLAFDLDARP